jgi:hypothetical protein
VDPQGVTLNNFNNTAVYLRLDDLVGVISTASAPNFTGNVLLWVLWLVKVGLLTEFDL